MWIIASIPFWITGILMAVLGTCTIIYGFFCVKTETTEEQTKFNITIFVAFVVIVLGGSIMVAAAKIAS